jgi:hypothetical protein
MSKVKSLSAIMLAVFYGFFSVFGLNNFLFCVDEDGKGHLEFSFLNDCCSPFSIPESGEKAQTISNKETASTGHCELCNDVQIHINAVIENGKQPFLSVVHYNGFVSVKSKSIQEIGDTHLYCKIKSDPHFRKTTVLLI